MVDLYLVADSRTTSEAMRAIPHLVGKPRSITFYVPGRKECGYAIACWREDFEEVKRALQDICPAGIYTFGTWSNVYRIDFRVPNRPTIVDTRARMIIAEESAPRGIVFDKSRLRYTFVKA